MSFRTIRNKPGIPQLVLPGAVPRANTPWVRNPSWISLTSVSSSDNKFVGVHAVWPDSNFVALSAAGDYTVDWGDGVTENISSGTQANHQYDYADADLANTNGPVTFTDSGDLVNRTAHGYTNGMTVQFYNIVSTTGLTEGYTYYVINATANNFQISTTLGGSAVALTTDGSGTLLPYKQALVTVTMQGGQTFTTLNLNLKNTQANLNAYASGFLDIAIAGSSLTDIRIGAATPSAITNNVVFSSLQRVNIASSALKNGGFLLASCYNLQSVVGIAVNTAAVTTLVCTTTDSGDTINYTAHGLVNGDPIVFSSITSTTGINVSTGYWVVGATANTFQVSTTYGGSAVALTTDGSCTVKAGTNFSGMFASCYSLTSVPLFNTAAGINFTSMFNSCYNLTSVPLFNTAAGTNFTSMFISCYSLTSVPLFNTAAGTNFSGMFASCYSLTSVPLFNTAAGTDFSSMFNSCYSLTSVPLFNTAAGTTFSSMFASSASLQSATLSGTKATISYASLKLSKSALEAIFTNLGVGTSQTITVSSNWGAPSPTALSGTTTAGSTTITMANTTGINVGDTITGTGTPCTTPIAVTFTDAGDLVNLTAHGLSNNDAVSFSSITTTTGIVINTTYYVVSATANNFQVALTVGGAAIALTNNGSGNLRYVAKVVTVNAGVSVVLDRPATSSGTNTISYRTLQVGIALLKGWAVTGG